MRGGPGDKSLPGGAGRGLAAVRAERATRSRHGPPMPCVRVSSMPRPAGGPPGRSPGRRQRPQLPGVGAAGRRRSATRAVSLALAMHLQAGTSTAGTDMATKPTVVRQGTARPAGLKEYGAHPPGVLGRDADIGADRRGGLPFPSPFATYWRCPSAEAFFAFRDTPSPRRRARHLSRTS